MHVCVLEHHRDNLHTSLPDQLHQIYDKVLFIKNKRFGLGCLFVWSFSEAIDGKRSFRWKINCKVSDFVLLGVADVNS